MSQQNLFDQQHTSPGLKKIVLRQLEARYITTTVRDAVPEWVATTRFNSPEQLYEMFRYLKDEGKEHFITLHLDGKSRINCYETVSIGSLNQSIVHPREVFKTALLSNAAAIILIHNHPSGDPAPSNEDRNITARLKECGDLIGIKVLDHIIIGDGYYSFVEKGLL